MSIQNAVLLKELMSKRRSVRSFSKKPLSVAFLEAFFYAGQGCTSADGRRTAPSAHALFPLTLMVVVRHVDGLVPGVYSHDSQARKLVRTQ